MGHKVIELSKGYRALVSEEDYERVSALKWHAQEQKNPDGTVRRVYARHSTNGTPRTLYLHRFILGLTDPDTIADHRDGNGLNCTRQNLRPVTREENIQHQRRRDNTSGFRGVDYQYRSGKWRAAICSNGTRKHLGLFESLADAAKTYAEAARALHGQFALVNAGL